VLKRLGDVGLAALAVLVVVLLVALVARQRTLTAQSPTGTRPSSPSTRTDEDSPAARADAATGRVADRRDGLLVHTPVTPCDPGDDAAVTVVRGERNETVPVDGLTTVTGVQVVDGDSIRVVGGDARCRPIQVTSSDSGATWRTDEEYAFWSLVPGRSGKVANSKGTVTVPCPARAVSGVDPVVARVLCDDGQVLGTADAGVTWVALGEDVRALAMSYATTSVGYTLAESEDCVGASVRKTLDGGATWSEIGCVELDGPWTVSANGESVVVVGSDGRSASEDAGRSWS